MNFFIICVGISFPLRLMSSGMKTIIRGIEWHCYKSFSKIGKINGFFLLVCSH